MASPQLENGYTSIANEILDNLCKLSLNGTELKVVICIFRYTFGFRRKSHKLSASFISRYGNCELSSVKRALKRLQEKKIVVCVNPEKKGVTAELMFNKNYEQWSTSSKKATSSEITTRSKTATSSKTATRPVAELPPEPVAELPPKKIKKEKQNINKNIYDDFFEKVWKSYPRKLNKSAVTQKAKKELYEAGEKAVLGAVNSYIAEIQENGTTERYIMYGSTFFNARWRDYIKEPELRVEVTAEEPAEKPIDLWSEE